jgi:hypothetical protein
MAPSISKLKIFLPFILLAGIALTQYQFDNKKLERPPIPLSIIPAGAIKLVDLGLHSAASAMMWLYSIQRLSDNIEKLPEMIKAVNNIDPKFSYPYAFSALILPSLGYKEEAVDIARRGVVEADPDWRIPYYLATTYHIFFEDRENAAFYFDVAANTPGAPEQIRTISARYGSAQTALEQTKQIWITIYETSDDEIVIEKAKNYIIHLEIVEALEKAISLYRKKYGSYPPTIESLVTGKILKEIPPSPLGVKFSMRDNKLFIE